MTEKSKDIKIRIVPSSDFNDLELTVNPRQTTVDFLKLKLQHSFAKPKDDWRLLFQGIQLIDDSKLLYELGVVCFLLSLLLLVLLEKRSNDYCFSFTGWQSLLFFHLTCVF